MFFKINLGWKNFDCLFGYPPWKWDAEQVFEDDKIFLLSPQGIAVTFK